MLQLELRYLMRQKKVTCLFGGAPNQSMDFNLVLRFFLALLICSTRFATNKKNGQQNQTNQNRVILGGAREKKIK